MNNVMLNYYCQALQAENMTEEFALAMCANILDAIDVVKAEKYLYKESKNFREICRRHRGVGRNLGRKQNDES